MLDFSQSDRLLDQLKQTHGPDVGIGRERDQLRDGRVEENIAGMLRGLRDWERRLLKPNTTFTESEAQADIDEAVAHARRFVEGD